MHLFKKLLTVLVLSLGSTMAVASETISIVWGFSMGSNQANTVRVLIEELNQMQNKYKFVIQSRPGAGGTIAANAVLSSPQNTLVSMSSSFIIRPLFENNPLSTHDLDNFVPVLVQGNGSPLVFVSSRYQTLEQLLRTQNINIGVSGIGSISYIAAKQLVSTTSGAQIVSFRSSVDAVAAAAGGHVDVAVSFVADAEPYTDKVSILGYTGTGEGIGNQQPLLKNNGFDNVSQLTSNFAIFASKELDTNKLQEIHDLLSRANIQPAVIESYQRDLLIPAVLDIDQSNDWYSSQIKFWKGMVNDTKNNHQ